jgi:site-specific recombinase XerD
MQEPCEHWSDILAAEGLITRDRPVTALSHASILIEEYGTYLREVRGFASSTVSNHRYTAQRFLQHLEEKGITLKRIQASHLESYVATAGKRLSRAGLQQ